MKKFNNRENKKHICEKSGKEIWASRSVASCIRFRLFNTSTLDVEHVILKRGDRVSNTGKWCFPCGFIDYDETVTEAAIRELYEETGFLITAKDEIVLYDIMAKPESMNQTVTFHFDVSISGSTTVIDMIKDNITKHVQDHIDEGEATEVKFVTIDDINPMGGEDFAVEKSFNFAFNHQDRFCEEPSEKRRSLSHLLPDV